MDAVAYRILIVDDSAEDRATYTRYLHGERESAYVVREASTGVAGLQACRDAPVDCVLLDYGLPDIDGVEFTQALIQHFGDGAPAIVMLTGQGSEQVARAAFQSGVQDYLVKGLTGLGVTMAIHSAIRGAVERQREKVRLLQAREAALVEADRRKDAFLATLAHELRNPLSPILTSMEILQRRYPADEAIAGSAGLVRRNVEHLTRLLDDLLDVARITTGKIDLQPCAVPLSDVLARVADQCGKMVSHGGHQLLIDAPRQPVGLHGDPVRLVQILSNIVVNACKFSPVGGPIALHAWVDGTRLMCSVTDHGIGLDPQALPQIFGMFAQVPNPALHVSGLGIGLSLARQFAEMHGGTITAFNAGLGKGSCFTVTLPIVRVAALPRDDHAAEAEPTVPSLAKRILVVDDNLDAAVTLKTVLELHGHEVMVAYGGSSAIALAAEQRPDIVLMDLGMPIMDGFEAMRRIRNSAPAAPMLLVAVTGWGDEAARRRTAEAGFDHHLVKPIDIDQACALLGL